MHPAPRTPPTPRKGSLVPSSLPPPVSFSGCLACLFLGGQHRAAALNGGLSIHDLAGLDLDDALRASQETVRKGAAWSDAPTTTYRPVLTSLVTRHVSDTPFPIAFEIVDGDEVADRVLWEVAATLARQESRGETGRRNACAGLGAFEYDPASIPGTSEVTLGDLMGHLGTVVQEQPEGSYDRAVIWGDSDGEPEDSGEGVGAPAPPPHSLGAGTSAGTSAGMRQTRASTLEPEEVPCEGGPRASGSRDTGSRGGRDSRDAVRSFHALDATPDTPGPPTATPNGRGGSRPSASSAGGTGRRGSRGGTGRGSTGGGRGGNPNDTDLGHVPYVHVPGEVPRIVRLYRV